MKKVISALTVAAMCASMAASAMPAFAIYQNGDVNTYLKVIEADKGTISEDGKTITFATAADAASAKLVVGQYLDCDASKPSIQTIYGAYSPSNTAIKLTGGVDMKGAYYSEEKTYEVNGLTYKTNCLVNCFAYLSATNKYVNGSMVREFGHSNEWTGDGWVGNGDNDVLTMSWAFDPSDKKHYPDDYTATAHFIDPAKSDAFPLIAFYAELDDSIAEGSYTIDFLKEYTNGARGEVMKGNFFQAGSDENPNVGVEVDFGTMTGITIKVGDATTPDPTTPDPTTPDPTTPDPTTPDPTDPPVPPTPGNYDWYVEDVVYDLQTGEGFVEIPVKVATDNDPGRIGYEFALTFDGKTIEDGAPFEGLELTEGDAYSFSTFAGNQDIAYVAAASGSNPENQYGAKGSTIVSFVVTIPEGAKAGDKYALGVTEVIGGDQDSVPVTVVVNGGTLTIVDGDEPPVDTTEPTPAATTEPTGVQGDYLYGDADENGKVELLDIVTLNRYLTGYDDQKLTDRGIVNANCFRNGESDADTTAKNLDGKDSMEILKYLIKLVTTLPTQG